MALVTVLPANISFEANTGETLMGAARARGLYWPTTCGGQGICTTCITEVVEGGHALAAMSRYETKTLTSERGPAILKRPIRLACQAAVVGEAPITVTKPGVRAADDI